MFVTASAFADLELSTTNSENSSALFTFFVEKDGNGNGKIKLDITGLQKGAIKNLEVRYDGNLYSGDKIVSTFRVGASGSENGALQSWGLDFFLPEVLDGYTVDYSSIGVKTKKNDNPVGYADNILSTLSVSVNGANVNITTPDGFADDDLTEGYLLLASLLDGDNDVFRLALTTSWKDSSVADQLVFTVYGTATPVSSATPEPATLAVFGLGVAGLAVLRRRKK